MSSDALKDRLSRLGRSIGGSGQGRSMPSVPETCRKLADRLGGEVVSNHAGAYCFVRTFYTHDHRHGDMTLADVLADAPLPLSAFTVEEVSRAAAPEELLFIDTETTGLGGTGAVAFLIGCGSLTEAGLEVRQYLMPDYSDEAAMLEAVLQEFDSLKRPVSYNGSAFDLPLLRDRMIINRVAREIAAPGHIDLLHPTRRLFKRRLADCALSNIERELFGFFRHDDIPGYLIPSIYFQWLSDGDPEPLAGVLKHNRLDIISLSFLAKRLADIHRTEGETLRHVDDLHSLSRVYGRRGRLEKAATLYERMSAEGLESLTSDIILYHSFVFKRSGSVEKAVSLWESLAESDSREGYWANLELSKYYEHRFRDVGRALGHAQRAGRCSCLTRSRRRELENRLRRLSAKLSQQ